MPGTLIKKTWPYDPVADAPARYRRACAYEAFIPQALAALQVTMDGRLAGLVAEAEQSVRTLNDEGGAALAPLARLLLRTESIASSKVEGMQVGIRELARAEARAESGILPGSDALELLANIDAMVLALEEATSARQFGVPEIVAIHQRLMDRAPHKRIAGRVRDRQNWIGGNDYNPCGADFVPPPPEDVHALLEDLCAAINDDSLPPLVQAALVHAQFETIHPFDDGNGRTGRALVHVVLRRRGVAPRFLPPISVVFARAKDKYIDGLTRFRGEEVKEWIEQFAEATDKAARIAGTYVANVRTLQQSWREKLESLDTKPRSDAAVWAIVNLLPAHPMITAPVLVGLVDRSRASVYDAIEQLASVGILIPLSSSKRNRVWEAEGMLDLIGDVELP